MVIAHDYLLIDFDLFICYLLLSVCVAKVTLC